MCSRFALSEIESPSELGFGYGTVSLDAEDSEALDLRESQDELLYGDVRADGRRYDDDEEEDEEESEFDDEDDGDDGDLDEEFDDDDFDEDDDDDDFDDDDFEEDE